MTLSRIDGYEYFRSVYESGMKAGDDLLRDHGGRGQDVTEFETISGQ